MMNDRFKFRAWDGSNWHYFNVDSLLYGDSMTSEYCDIDEWKHITQSTGLKDKNGTLIFEGDIIKMYNTGWPEDWRGAVRLEQRVFNQFQYVLDRPKSQGGATTYNHWRRRDIKIIGNIYEDPDLLV